jgi:pyruvate,orthophosphate dikinase
VLLVRKDTSPEDIGGMVVSQGVLTSTGGTTSHAAVVARGLGTPCVAGAKGVSVQEDSVRVGEKIFYEGDWLTIDGSTGDVYEGQLPLIAPDISDDMNTFLSWCDHVRESSVRGKVKGFQVRTNADQPEDALRAFSFGADGVGLCRTEHMFFHKEKLIHFRSMIVANTEEERRRHLAEILPLQRRDFFGIFKAMEGRPVTIRLLDPPLHEFVPHTVEEIQELADHLGQQVEALKPKLDKLREANPMLGHRGCRLAVTYPEIYDMQVEAIALAAVDCLRQNIPVEPEIMIPIVVTARELKLLRPNAEAVLKRVFAGEGVDFPPVHIGTMIEVPRAAIRSGHIARYADFFSFGTNDLTQMTFAFSRDDVASFLPTYLEKHVLDVDPFKSIDEDGVGDLIRYAIGEGRTVKPDLKIGICGEHGGDPVTIDFCYRAGLSYVSCSPFRVPLARLAGAQAVINNSKVSTAENGVKTGAVKTGERTMVSKKEAKFMSDSVKKPAAKKPAGRKPAEKKTAAKPVAKKPAGKKLADKKTAAKKPAAKKAVDKKTTAKPAVKKPAEKKTAAKSVAKKPAGRKPAENKTTAKAAAKKPAGRKTVEKKTAAKPTAKKPAARKVAEKKTAAKPAAKKPAGRKPAEKKTTAKAAAKKPVGRKPAEKKTTVKAAVKKPAGRKPADKKTAAKPTAKKPAAKKPAGRKPAEKKTTAKPAVKKPAGRKPAVKPEGIQIRPPAEWSGKSK